MVSKTPSGRYGTAKNRDETAERRRQLEYTISYGIEYGLVSAMTHTLQQASPETALADPGALKFIGGNQPRKIVFVQDRLVNIVV